MFSLETQSKGLFLKIESEEPVVNPFNISMCFYRSTLTVHS